MQCDCYWECLAWDEFGWVGSWCSRPGEFCEGPASDKSPIAALLGEKCIFFL